MRSPLSRERWTKVECLFITAAGLPPGERRRFLAAECGGDDELLEEVSSLLRYDTRGPDIEKGLGIEDALGQGASSLLESKPLENTLLGPWRVERELGRGGMSVVYLAARSDGHFSKQVAIKVIKRGMDTAAVVDRFRRERRILAALDHPWIARLLDGGTTADGLPYIVMDYVEGLPIDRWCDTHALSVEQRCELIIKVCDAVAYAHRNLVIHRDLKPGNILVGEDGNPKLLDFGIAKLLGDGEDPGSGAETRGPMRPLTPEYASPEQLTGGAVGTATDVYSLGVALFELLTGRRPQGEKASDAAGESGKGRRWVKQLTGDLDKILQMALREEPERRYPTIDQFQADLRRYLAGLPVAARPENWHYRFGKFVRRHPAGAAMSLAAVLAAAVFAGVERDAQIQREKSEQRLGEVIALANTSLFNLHGSIENLPGATQARLEIARKTTGYLDKLNRESGGDPRVLAALASAYTQVARVEGNPNQPNLGDEPSAEQNYSKAETLFAGLMTHSATTELRIQYADVRQEFAQLLEYEGRNDKALAEFRSALDQAGTVLKNDPHNLEARKIVGQTHLGIANITRFGDPGGSRQTLLNELPSYEALTREYPGDTDALQNMSSFWAIVGMTFNIQGSLSDAADSFRKSAELSERLFTLKPGDVQIQRDLMEGYGHLGDVTGGPAVINMGDYRAAIGWFGKAAAIAEKMAAADPSNVLALSDSGTAWGRVGESQAAAGDYGGALETFKRAEPILLKALATAPESRIVAQTLAFLYDYKARAFHALGDEAAEAENLQHALDLCRSGLKKEPANASWNHMAWWSRGMLAISLALRGDTNGGLAQAQQVLETVHNSPVPNDVSTHAYLARALDANGSVHALIAKRESGETRVSEWRTAADYYERAVGEWQLYPYHEKEPGVVDFRRTEAGLEEARRELRVASRGANDVSR